MIAWARHSVTISASADPPASIPRPLGQEIIHDAVNNGEQRVEVGVGS